MRKNIQYILLVILSIGYLSMGWAQTPQQEKYAEVKIYTGKNGLKELAGLGLPVDHGIRKKGAFFISDFSESEIKTIAAAGFKYEILQDDLAKFYVARNLNPTYEKQGNAINCGASVGEYPIPKGFNYGSMGGYLTYDELMTELDSMYAEYGDIISERAAIDTFQTHEGRPIYWLKISDNPTVDEGEEEPQVLYTGLHHSREPMSMTQMIYYMHFLLENYGKDEWITFLIDNTEMYFIPCVNPDGYVYNEETNPDGGGLWRKNKRDNNGDGMFNIFDDGVDLNRNYGYEWAYDDDGSSSDPGSAVYRGFAPFSEPETQAIKHFCEAHNFLIALNYHSFSNLLIYPWGFVGSFLTPDSTLFEEYAGLMTDENNYLAGTADQTVGYLVNGDADDWMYGEQETKNKILALTPEVGGGNDGFWPPQTRIIPLCQENMLQNLMVARLVHQYANIEEDSDIYVSNYDVNIPFSLAQLGLKGGTGFNVTIEPVNDAVADAGNGTFVFSPSLLGNAFGTLPVQLKDDIASGDEIIFNINVENEEGLAVSKTINKYFGESVLDYENAVSTNAEWELIGARNDWALIDNDFISSPNSFTDSPNGDYESGLNTTTRLLDTIDLTDCKHAVLKFWAKWDIEQNFDYVQIQAVRENGSREALCGKYTRIGGRFQDSGQPLYDGTQVNWLQEQMDLVDFIGQKINVQIRMRTDNAVSADGFYIDQIEVHKLLSDSIQTSNENINTPSQKLLLGQNQPNPVADKTLIPYQLPQHQINEALELLVVNTIGQVIYRETLPKGQTAGQLTVDTNAFNNGIYYYYLLGKNNTSSIQKMVVMH